MEVKVFLILKVFTYFALLPVVFRSLMSIELSKIFKKHHTGEVRMVFILLAIVISKIVGDFLIDIMEIFLKIVGFYPI
jgi:uncharacterized membrane protein YwzB